MHELRQCQPPCIVVTDLSFDYVRFVVTEAQVEGSTIPKAVAMETSVGGVESVMPVAGMPEGVALGPEALVAPR
jgi:hypothetical protein